MSTAAASGAAAGGGSSGSSGSGVRDAQTLTVASLTAPKPAAPAAAAPAVATAHPSTRAAHKRVGGAAQSHTNSFAGVDEELLASVLMTPLVRGTVRPPSMQDRMVLAGSAAYLDPTSALHSTMRALYVVKQVLRANGDVYVVNGNSLTAPLMREVAHCCTNANVWFHQGRWRAGSLSRPSAAAKALFKKSHQPNQEVFASRGLTLANLHAPPSTTLAAAGAGTGRNGDEPRLGSLDKWRLWHLGRSEKEATDVLRLLMKQESESAKLPLPGTARGDVASRVRLVVTLAPTHDGAAIDEAFAIGIPTIALVNAHSPLDHITYPVYASDAHVRFQHFFLDWFLKVVNLPPAAK